MLLTVFTFAQRNGGNHEAKIQKRDDRMTEQLNLSADQQVKVKDLLTAQLETRKSKKEKRKELSETEKEAMKAERKAAKASFDTEMASILTAEQLELYKDMPKKKGRKGAAKKKGNKKAKASRKKGASKKSPEERTQEKVAKLTEELGLSEAQQAKLTELMVNSKPSKKNKTVNKDLSAEEREAMKAERKAAKEAYKTEFEAILTAEQLATYQKMKAERKDKRKAKGKKANKRK